MTFLKKFTPFFFRKIPLFFLGVFLSLLLLESGIRLGGFIFRSVQDYRNGRSISQKGSYRILCIGESTTENQYPQQLERILNERNIGIRFSVIDKGRTQANTRTILSHIEEDLDEFHPNMVIAMMGINDKSVKYYQDISNTCSWAFEHCRTYKFFKILWMNFLKKIRRENFCRLDSTDSNVSCSLMRGQIVNKDLKEVVTDKSSFRFEISNDYFLSGQRLAKQGKYGLAKSSFERSIALNPENDGAYVELGRLLRKLCESVLAEDSFRQTLKINPHNDQAFAELGWINLWQGEKQLAEDFFKQALELNPKNDSAYVGLAIAYIPQSKFSQAEKFLEKALELHPESNMAMSVLGAFYLDQGDISKAEIFSKKAIALEPRDYRAFQSLIWIYRVRGEFAEAKNLLRKAAAMIPERAERQLRALASLDAEFGKTHRGMKPAQHIAILDRDYSAMTYDNYHKLKAILERSGIKLVCVQYPIRSVATLKNVFAGEKGVIYVDNEQVFKKALKEANYADYFRDMFGGDFGHCTAKGNELLAQNIADVILREEFNK